MSKYAINDTTLTAIADSIRAKGGTSDPIQVSNFADAIANLPSGGGDFTAEDFTFSGNLSDFNSGDGFRGLLEKSKNLNLLSFQDVTNTSNFCNSSDFDFSDVPFSIAPNTGSGSSDGVFSRGFYNYQGTKLPQITGSVSTGRIFGMAQYCLANMPNITNFDNVFDSIDWSNPVVDNYTSGREIFYNCYRLRRLPPSFILKHWDSGNTWGNLYSNLCSSCYVLDEAVDLPVFDNQYMRIDSGCFRYCEHLKRVTFETNEGTPIVVSNWNYNQTLDLSNSVGYGSGLSSYGLPGDKIITGATYQELKDDPDAWSPTLEYSRYNHDSAVETINSLPDASGITGYTNTIKFKGNSGSATDGGAINTLTEEEIAVAAAKGWTVSLV